MRKKRMRCPRLYFSIRSRHSRFLCTVSMSRFSEYDRSRKVWLLVHPTVRLIHGYPIFIGNRQRPRSGSFRSTRSGVPARKICSLEARLFSIEPGLCPTLPSRPPAPGKKSQGNRTWSRPDLTSAGLPEPPRDLVSHPMVRYLPFV